MVIDGHRRGRPHRRADATSIAPPPQTAVKRPRRLISRGWLVLFVGVRASMAASQTLFVTFGRWLEDEFGLTPAGLSVVTFVLGAGELVATLSVAHVHRRVGQATRRSQSERPDDPASAGLALWHDNLVARRGSAGDRRCSAFEFSIVSAISLGTGLVPGSPARGLGLLIGVDTVGRAVMSVPRRGSTPATASGGRAAMRTLLAVVAAVTIVLSGSPDDPSPQVTSRIVIPSESSVTKRAPGVDAIPS